MTASQDTEDRFVLISSPEYNAELTELYKPCTHPKTELRRRVISNGQTRYGVQCLVCGSSIKVIPRSSLNDVSRVPDYDENIQVCYRERRQRRVSEVRERYLRLQAAEKSQWWAWYSQYLQSPAWRKKRDLVIRRAKGMCEGCGEKPVDQVHHLTYDHAGDEFLWELVAVCRPCHDRVHDSSER
jgi:5-methylcytosine-specific restriction endonuclease McrA